MDHDTASGRAQFDPFDSIYLPQLCGHLLQAVTGPALGTTAGRGHESCGQRVREVWL